MTDASPLLFWVLAAAMAGVAIAVVLPRLLAAPRPARGGSRRALNLEVYRGQLADLEHDRATGELEAEDYQRQRTDIERRMLEETRDEPGSGPGGRGRLVPWLVGLALPVGAAALYGVFGTPAALEPGAQRSAAEDPAAFRASLERHLARSPADARAWVLLARADMEADRFAEAANAYAKAVAANGRVARDPEVLTEYADALGMVQQNLAGLPTELIDKALVLAPGHPRALEMAGSAAFERGDYGRASALWRQLQQQLAPGTRPYQDLGVAIERAGKLARSEAPVAEAPAGAKPKP